MWTPHTHTDARHRRRGSVYVLVLLAIIVCSAMLVSALDLVRSRHRFAAHTGDYFQANANAAAGLELALRDVESTPAWRWAPGDGAWYTDVAMPGGGTVSVQVTGRSSALSTVARDPALITSIGTHGSTRAIQQVTVGLRTDAGPPITGPSIGAYGLLAWWPLDDRFTMSSHLVFMRLHKREWSEFIQLHNFKAVGRELVVCLPLVLAALLSRRRKQAGPV